MISAKSVGSCSSDTPYSVLVNAETWWLLCWKQAPGYLPLVGQVLYDFTSSCPCPANDNNFRQLFWRQICCLNTWFTADDQEANVHDIRQMNDRQLRKVLGQDELNTTWRRCTTVELNSVLFNFSSPDSGSLEAAATLVGPEVQVESRSMVSLEKLELFLRSGAVRVYNVLAWLISESSDLLADGTVLSPGRLMAWFEHSSETWLYRRGMKAQSKLSTIFSLGDALRFHKSLNPSYFADLYCTGRLRNCGSDNGHKTWRIGKDVYWISKKRQFFHSVLLLVKFILAVRNYSRMKYSWGKPGTFPENSISIISADFTEVISLGQVVQYSSLVLSPLFMYYWKIMIPKVRIEMFPINRYDDLIEKVFIYSLGFKRPGFQLF